MPKTSSFYAGIVLVYKFHDIVFNDLCCLAYFNKFGSLLQLKNLETKSQTYVVVRFIVRMQSMQAMDLFKCIAFRVETPLSSITCYSKGLGKLQTIMLSKSLLLQVPRQHSAFAQIKIIILMF